MIEFNEDKIKRRTEDILQKEAEELAQYLGTKYGVPYIDLSLVSISPEALAAVEEEKARAANLAGFRIVDKTLSVAVLSPVNKTTTKTLAELEAAGYRLNTYITSEHGLKRAWKYYEDIKSIDEIEGGQIDISEKNLEEFVKTTHNIDETRALILEIGKESGSKTTNLLEIIVAGAIAAGASDVHIEAEEDSVRLRYRIDGILQDLGNLSRHNYRLLGARIKLLSSLKLNVGSKRQDGRFSVHLGEREIDIRTSVIPGSYGESVVLRILDQQNINILQLASLGIEPHLLSVIKNELKKPNGMILVTGPTGSGKTTSLYAFLQDINNSNIKIITIEDPIEYGIEGVLQTSVDVDKGYDFNEGLKSAMRQDPDVIMVGEIRDSETAATAVDASLTGHLVFSTLHTNNAAGTVPRLLDLMINPKVMGSALNITLAQRLVRRLCESCKKTRALNDEERQVLETGVAELKQMKTSDVELMLPSEVYESVGCDKCDNSGFSGRIGIYEAIVVDGSMEDVIQSNPSEHEVWQAASTQGIPTMRQDGIIKVLRGITTVEELGRVVNLVDPSPNIKDASN